MQFDWSLGRDTPQQEAASRLVWRARQRQRSNGFLIGFAPFCCIFKSTEAEHSAVIGQCDRALGWNARGDTLGAPEKIAELPLSNFSASPVNRSRVSFHPKTAAHCTVATRSLKQEQIQK